MVEEGQKVKVKVLKIADNKISLSMKALEESREAEKSRPGSNIKKRKRHRPALETYWQILSYNQRGIKRWQVQALAHYSELQRGGDPWRGA